jgi:hypothetical protein
MALLLQLGTCERGFDDKSISDVIFSTSTVKKVGDLKAQYFWEVSFTTSITQLLFLRIFTKIITGISNRIGSMTKLYP